VITAATLTGSATSASLTQLGNLVGTLGAFSTSAGFALTDNQALLVTGPVIDAGAASTLALTTKTGDITLTGTVTAINLVDLISAGAINQTAGTLIANVLTGSAATSASLTKPVNLVGTLGAFSTTAGFALTDDQPLLVNGPVVDTGATSALALTSKIGDITLAGTVHAANIVNLISAGTISQTGDRLIAGTLTGSAAGSASLAQPANQVGTLNGFNADGFALDNSSGLTVLGTVSGGPTATVANKGPLTINGTVTAQVVSITADSIGIPGNVTGTSVALFGTVGAITETGLLNASTLTGSAVTTAGLTGTSFSNSITTLNGFTAAGFTLDNGIGLTVLGTLSGGPSATIADTGPLAVNGTVSATAVSLTADSITIPGNVKGNTVALFGTVGAISETGVLSAGALTGSAATIANLTGTAFSNQIGTVSRFTAAGFTLDDGADLTVTGSISGGPSVTLAGAGTVAVAAGGAVIGNTLSITASGSINIAGTAQAANNVRLVSNNGSITEPGTLVAALLTGSTAGDATLTGTSASNAVIQLGSFTSGGTFTLDDGVALTINGPLIAPTIIIDAGANTLTLADKAELTTGGTQRPPETVPNFPPDALTTNGAYLTTSSGFTQQGSSTIFGLAGSPSVLRINAQGDANVTFDPVAGLQGTNTWLILDIGTGKATGQIHVKSLDVLHSGQTGGASLNGTVTGLSGPAAAGAAGIQPNPNSNFRINSCPIGSVNCVLLPSQAVPTANPLNDIYFASLFNPNDEDDLLLPIVSDQDY
jgi:fibronectin-binding autotransporter adhesin